MKIVQINTFSYKAAGNIMMNIHNQMLKNGIDSYVAWGRGRKAENDHEYYMNDDLGVKIHGVYTRVMDKHGFRSIQATKKLLKWIDSINPDIIHLHCIHGYYINIELLFNYIREKNIKVVWTQHDCWAFTGHCAYFDAVGCDKWKTGCHDCQQLSTYPASKVIDNSRWNWKKNKTLVSGLDITIVTPCKWLADLMKNSFLGENPIEVIYNGIDTDVFKYVESDFKKKYEIEDKKIILGVAGEWTERKGLKDFVKLNELIDKTQYVIVVVGVTKEQIKELPDDIIAISRTDNVNQLVEIYSSADVYFNPTYEDNFPTTNLEAQACGIPVITYETGGSPESVNPNYVVEKGNIEQVIDLIYQERNIDRTFLNKKMNKESMINGYIDLYYEFYGGRNG